MDANFGECPRDSVSHGVADPESRLALKPFSGRDTGVSPFLSEGPSLRRALVSPAPDDPRGRGSRATG